MLTDPIVEMNKVTIYRGNSRILKGIDLRIEAGEQVVILGPNGSGKSTLIKTMIGECRHDTTNEDSYVRILGTDMWDHHDVRKAFGVVSSEIQMDLRREIDGLEAVVSGFFGSIGTNRSQAVSREMNRKARKALASVGSEHLARKMMSVMSMGEARRVIMARALVNEPEALILDEPMNALDLTGKYLVREAMRSLARKGKTLVLVTQDPSDIIPEMDRMVMIRDGRIFLDGDIEQLNEDILSRLFGVPIRLCRIEDRYSVWS